TSRSTRRMCTLPVSRCFFFKHPATTAIYTLSLHDALPISAGSFGDPARYSSAVRSESRLKRRFARQARQIPAGTRGPGHSRGRRSEEHTSELQSRENLVCRLLLEKKKEKHQRHTAHSSR